jgi:hypothetical protein
LWTAPEMFDENAPSNQGNKMDVLECRVYRTGDMDRVAVLEWTRHPRCLGSALTCKAATALAGRRSLDCGNK